MRLRQTFQVAIMGAGLCLFPAFMQATRAADEPAQDAPKADAPKTDAPPENRPPGDRPPPDRGPGDRPGPGQRDPTPMLDRYHKAVTELKLTDEQKPKIEAAFEKAKKALDDLQAKPPEEGEGLQAFGKVTTELRETVRGILDEDQQKELASKMAQGGPGGRGGGALGFMRQGLDQVGLTEEQKTKVDAAVKEAQDKLEAARKDAGDDPGAIRDKMRPIFEDLQKKIQDVLTQEQKDKLEKIRQGQRDRFPQGGGPGGPDRPPQPPQPQ